MATDDENQASKGRWNLIPLLEQDGGNFDAWDSDLRDKAYSKGWAAFLTALDADPDADGVYPNAGGASFNASARRDAWLMMTHSLSAKLKLRTADIEKGQVEDLHRRLKARYYLDSRLTRMQLRDRLHSVSLEQHNSLQEYIDEINQIERRLANLGHAVPEEDLIHRLVTGLPAEYDPAVEHIESKADMSWVDTKAYLINWLQRHPNVRGSTASCKAGCEGRRAPRTP